MCDESPEIFYLEARCRGWVGQVWSILSGRPRCLLPLAEANASCTVRARYDAGLRTVPIDRIRGSEGRCHDFDRSFYPLQDHSEHRWLRVARARQEGKSLPPVELVQVGETYYCLDGHHRISVARAFHQPYIEATVTVWQVEEPLPGASSASPAQPQGTRSRLNLRSLLPALLRAGRGATS